MKGSEKHLFRNDARTFAVLDGAAVPDLPVELYKSSLPHVCLYRGELPPDLVHAAPYLVMLLPDSEFTKWLLANCGGKHWGIFAQTRSTLTSMRSHFRSFLTVYDESGKPLLFRYYDPRVFNTYLPTCNGGELQTFFGSVLSYFSQSTDGGSLVCFSFEGNELKKVRFDLSAKGS